MQASVPSFAILQSGEIVIFDGQGRLFDVLPPRLTSAFLSLLACATSEDGSEIEPHGADEP